MAKKTENLFISLSAKCRVLSHLSLVHSRPNNQDHETSKAQIEESLASIFITLKRMADTDLVDFESIISKAEHAVIKGNKT